MNQNEPCFKKCRFCQQFSFLQFPKKGYCIDCEYYEIYQPERKTAPEGIVNPYDYENMKDIVEELKCA